MEGGPQGPARLYVVHFLCELLRGKKKVFIFLSFSIPASTALRQIISSKTKHMSKTRQNREEPVSGGFWLLPSVAVSLQLRPIALRPRLPFLRASAQEVVSSGLLERSMHTDFQTPNPETAQHPLVYFLHHLFLIR